LRKNLEKVNNHTLTLFNAKLISLDLLNKVSELSCSLKKNFHKKNMMRGILEQRKQKILKMTKNDKMNYRS
jgi:hypothetical protein